MIRFHLTGCAGIALCIAVPVVAGQQQTAAQSDSVKAGVDAWSAGDFDRAVAAWKGPAERGDADAQFNLAQAYRRGRGVPADLNRAEDLYRRAAEQGHSQAADNYGLALFENGKKAQSVEWLSKSAARGEPRAQYVLGTMYFNGDAVAKDWARAYALVSRAASSGLPQASATLTQMDQYIPMADKQRGIVLARQWESGKPMTPAEVETAAVTTPAAAPTPAPAAMQPAPAKPAPKPAPAIRDGGWRVQLGAFATPGNARGLWSDVAGRFPGREPFYMKAGKVTRLQVGPFASRAEAAQACRKVDPCLPVRK